MLIALCIRVLARFPDRLPPAPRIPASPALLDALRDARDPCLWATLAQLVHSLPPHLHDLDVPLSHSALPLLRRIPPSPDFTLVTLLSLPNCLHLRDDTIPHLRTLPCLLALDLRGCSISSYALTALVRGLPASPCDDPAGTGVWGLRLLSLHGCPNIDNDALSALLKFPLLSAVDLRFTRCTPAAVNAYLSSLGFHPSDNNSLFHPAPLSVALCSLEKLALAASLYSCPPQSVFRIHIDELGRLPSHPKKAVPAGNSTTSIQTTSFTEDTVVFFLPLRKQAKSEPRPATVVPVSSTDRPTYPSNASSFYENAPKRDKYFNKSILPLSAQAVQPSEGSKLDPLAVARPPPPWNILYAYSLSKDTRTGRCTGSTLNNTLKVDHARLNKRGSDTVADMAHQFARKRPKIESEFALAKTRTNRFVKSRNPFSRCARSVFAEGNDKPQSLVQKSSREEEPATQLRACHSLPSDAAYQQGTTAERTVKPLKPITTLKPPILPKELLPSPRHASKPKLDLKQTRLTFARQGTESMD